MKTETPPPNGNGTPEAPTIIYLCQPIRDHKHAGCTACGGPFNEPYVRFFLGRDPARPVCRTCVRRHGFIIERPGGGQAFRCHRAKSGATIMSEVEDEWPSARMDAVIDRWLGRRKADGNGGLLR